MSLIFGCWLFEPGKSVANTLERMCTTLAVLSQGAYNQRIHNNTGVGHIRTLPHTTDSQEASIFLNATFLFTAQGRIDNSPALCRKLGIEISDGYTPEYLMWQSFLKWGKDCVNELRGDWSFAVWNYETQELFIARDPMGYTALYYYQDATGFYFSSSLKNLLTLPSYQKQLNEEYWLRMLTLWDHLEANHQTFFKGIHTIPLAHTLTLKKDSKVTLNRYWYPQHTSIRIYKNKQDYAEEMYDIFSHAVAVRLKSPKPIASMLSGGLDSSAVSYIAARLLQQKNIPLTTFSHVPLFQKELQGIDIAEKQILDETPLILETVKAAGNINPILLNSANYSILQGMIDVLKIYDAPIHGAFNAYWIQDIFRTASQKGFGVLLTGEGGNGSISFKGRPQLLPLQWKQVLQHPFRYLKSHIAKPIVKTLYPQYFEKRKRAHNDLADYVTMIFANEQLLQKYQILEDIQTNQKSFQLNIKDINELKEQFVSLYQIRSLFGAAHNHFYGVEMRDPCADQDVMEFFFSLPNEAFFDEHHNNRMLVKRMMKGRIPDSVLFEKKKGLQSSDILYRVKAQQHEITEAIALLSKSAAATSCIDVQKLSAAWQTYLAQPYTSPFQIQCLLKAIHFGLFLQMHFD